MKGFLGNKGDLKFVAIKIAAIILIAIMIACLVLMILGKISGLYFFVVAAIIAIFAYKVIPKLRENI